MSELLLIFIALNILNVILSTIKTICMAKCTPFVAGLVSALYYILYTFVLIYTTCELSMWLKAFIVGGCNLIGVFVVKTIDKKLQKDLLWKIEFTVNANYKGEIIKLLDDKSIPFNYQEMGKHIMFNAYCDTQHDSHEVAQIVKAYNGKYFVSSNGGKLW